MNEEALHQAKEEANQQVKKLKNAMYLSSLTDITSGITSFVGNIGMSIWKSTKKFVTKDLGSDSFFGSLKDGLSANWNELKDKINPVEEIKKAKEVQEKLIDIISNTNKAEEVKKIKENIGKTELKIKTQSIADAARTGASLIPVPIPGAKTAVKGVIGEITKAGIEKLASATVSIVVEEVVEKSTKEVNDSEDTEVESVLGYRANEALKQAEITSLNKDTIKILLEAKAEAKAEAKDQSGGTSETYEKIKEKFQSFSGDKVVTARNVFPNNMEYSQNKRSENPRVV
jgi:hypothetical protein